ncbi:MAG: hypothetical protein KKA73_07355 [Chloroflexi bacterium]|nr:hypothetical protein [Chloroflexota bacterium]MBU1747488.1 hypothetical protein [Chloroflexota bacterium]
MVAVLSWWLALEALGLAVWPLAANLFKNLPDRGYPLAKALGLLLTGYFFWLLGMLGVLENTPGAIMLVALALAAGCWLVSRDWRQQAVAQLREQWRLILFAEALFALAFLTLVVLRAYNPEIGGTEKPMDFAFLNGILRSRQFPPLDPWMSGYTISYYYLGYLLMAMLTRLTGTLPGVAFNLSIATVFALTAGGVGSLVYNLVTRRAGRPSATALLFGALGAIFVLVLGNLEGFLEVIYAQGWLPAEFWQWLYVSSDAGGLFLPRLPTGGIPTDNWWWWRASRVIPGAIDEFPFFSFLLADLHPHVMALPFGVLVLSLGLAVLGAPARSLDAEREPLPHATPKSFDWHRLWPVGLSGWAPLLVGGLGFLNSWDLPTFGLVVIAAYAIWAYAQQEWRGWTWLWRVGHYAVVLVGLSFVLYLPFYLGPRISTEGLAPVMGNYTSLAHLLVFFGPFLLLALALVVDGWRRSREIKGTGILGLLAVGVPVVLALAWVVAILVARMAGLVPDDQVPALTDLTAKPAHLVVYTLLAMAALWVLVRLMLLPGNGNRTADRFVLLLVALSFVLLLICETFYIRDVFSSRMNTVFKFYYQAWVLLAIAAAYALYALPRRWPRWAGVTVTVVSGALVLAGLVYPLLAVPSKAGDFQREPTLDGTAWLAGSYPGDLKAITWLNEQVPGAPVILETVGGEWGDYSHISAMTGLPTVMGWAGHEWQWRGEYPSQREADVKAIYEGDTATARALLDQYNVMFVYVGTLERADYTPEALAKFATFMDVVYDVDGIVIYKRR